jgi:TonB family protein
VFYEEFLLKLQAKYLKALRFIAIAAALAFAVGFVSQAAIAQTVEQSGDRKVKQKITATYPELARHANIGGIVKLEATIAANGQVKNVKILGGHPLLAGAAEDALRRWKYEPSSGETTAVVEFKFTPGM